MAHLSHIYGDELTIAVGQSLGYRIHNDPQPDYHLYSALSADVFGGKGMKHWGRENGTVTFP